MKTIVVTLTHTLKVPDECVLVKGGPGDLLKWGEKYLAPRIEYLESANQLGPTMQA